MYFRLLLFHLQRLRVYWLEAVGVWVRMVLQLSMLLLFWRIVSASSTVPLDTRHLLAYFLIASAVNEFTMIMNLRFSGTIMDGIKTGTISQVLLRPFRVAPYLYAQTVGDNLVATTFLLPALIAGMIIERPTLLGVMLFIPALLFSALISFAINLLIGCVAFIVVEARSIRWVMNFPIQFLSGALIPLSFFPDAWRSILLRTPFPGLIAGPTLALQATSLTPELVSLLTWSALWSILLPLIALAVWERARRSYEAVGL